MSVSKAIVPSRIERAIDAARRSGLRHVAVCCAALAACLALAAPAFAEEDGKADDATAGSIKMELNAVENVGDGCKVTLLLDNRGPSLKSLKVWLFALDTDGIVQKNIVIDLGPIREKKLKVRPFDFAGIACPKLGRIILNDVTACEGESGSADDCLDRIATSSKTKVDLVR